MFNFVSMNRPVITYTDPALCHYSFDMKKNWFVYFDITDHTTNKTIRKQFRGGINYWKTKEDRVREGNALISYWKKQLKGGWSPFAENAITQAAGLAGMKLPDALDFALSKCVLAQNTKFAYSWTVKQVKKVLLTLNLHVWPVADIKRQHIKLIFDQIRKERDWSNKAYNKNVRYFGSIMAHLVEWEIIESNPAKDIKKLAVVETIKYEAYTAAEKKKIYEYLSTHHYPYFVYLMVIYHTGIRPKEVLALKISDIDMKAREIVIKPDMKEENSKTKKLRIVPLNNHLVAFFEEMELDKYPANYYVFGSPRRPGGPPCSAEKSPGFFKPSPNRMPRVTVSELWRKVVKVKLGINKYQYAMKHTGADDKILAGMDLDVLRRLYGHSSKFMTEKYAQKVKEVFKQKIIEQSPSFI